MKVSKPPSGSLSGPPVGVPAAKSAGAKGFADKLARARGSGQVRAATAARPPARAHEVAGIADIGNALRAGQITPRAALDRVVERIVARRVGPNGSAAIAEKLNAAMCQTLADDPMLAAKIRALDEG
jgi:hypothetical protein